MPTHEDDIKTFSDTVQKLGQTYGELVTLLARASIDKEHPLHCVMVNDLTRNAYSSLFHNLGLLDFDRQLMDSLLLEEIRNGQWYTKTDEERRMFFMNQALLLASKAQCIMVTRHAMSILKFPDEKSGK